MEPAPASGALREFIEAAKGGGATDLFVVELLKQRGWPEKDIYQAFTAHYETATGISVPVRGGSGEAARDAFLYLLSFFTLGTWSIALGSLFFTFVDHWFPDRVAGQVQYAGSSYSVSSEMASIIVAFPIYLFVMRWILREAESRPEKRHSSIRKWLTYIALLIAAGVLIGDLITFLAWFLRGELTPRFVLKVLAVITIAGGIFWYYFSSLKDAAGDAEA